MFPQRTNTCHAHVARGSKQVRLSAQRLTFAPTTDPVSAWYFRPHQAGSDDGQEEARRDAADRAADEVRRRLRDAQSGNLVQRVSAVRHISNREVPGHLWGRQGSHFPKQGCGGCVAMSCASGVDTIRPVLRRFGGKMNWPRQRRSRRRLSRGLSGRGLPPGKEKGPGSKGLPPLRRTPHSLLLYLLRIPLIESAECATGKSKEFVPKVFRPEVFSR